MDARRTLLQMPGSCPWGSLQPGAERDSERIQREWGSGPQVASLFLCQTNSMVYKYIGSVSSKINYTIFSETYATVDFAVLRVLMKQHTGKLLSWECIPSYRCIQTHTQEPAFTYAACVCMNAPQWGSCNTPQLSQELPAFPHSGMNSLIQDF